MTISPAPYAYSTPNSELIKQLKLQVHPEGGYFVETDRREEQVPSPYAGGQDRSLATSIYYLLTASQPNGVWHMNKSVTYHVLHQGRAEYTLIHPTNPPRIETMIMGDNAAAGETRMLLVGTGVWKKSRILPEDLKTAQTDEQKERVGCLITEVVVPGFHWEDHKYLTMAEFDALFEGASESDMKDKETLRAFVKKV